MKKKFNNLLLLVLVFALLLFLLFNRHAYIFSGYAIGTTYKVVVYDRLIYPKTVREMKIAIEDELYRMNSLFSNFEEGSELSKLNAVSPNVYFKGSDELVNVLVLAKDVYRLTDGLYDPTVDPLVRLWGFGRDMKYIYPSKSEIESAVAGVGYDKVIITGNIIYKKDKVTIDLASIAKGYAVDEVVKVLEKFNQKNYMVEIGGELYVKGDEFYKTGWDVVIVNPDKVKKGIMTIRLKNKGVATSGSYRNFRVHEDGKKYQHIIDPKTGYPVFNNLVSATIIANTVVQADALATGVMVMGTEKGIQLINSMQDVEAILIENTEKGLKIIKSAGL